MNKPEFAINKKPSPERPKYYLTLEEPYVPSEVATVMLHTEDGVSVPLVGIRFDMGQISVARWCSGFPEVVARDKGGRVKDFWGE